MRLFYSPKLSRFFALFTILWCLMLAVGCAANWISEATNIIQLLVPSITSILSILTAFGVPVGLSAAALAAVQSWANQATAGLQTVGGLIDQYNKAEATAQPGILTEIQTVLSTIVANLSTILPEIHVTDPSSQAKITAVIEAVQAEMQALINLVPAIKSATESSTDPHEQLKKIASAPAFHELKSAKSYRSDFNSKAGVFGKEYCI